MSELARLRDHCRWMEENAEEEKDRPVWGLLADDLDAYLEPAQDHETPDLFETPTGAQ